MNKTTFKISGMDCLSEEQLIKMKLEPIPSVKNLLFDLTERTLTIYHTGDLDLITKEIESLKLSSKLIKTVEENTQSIEYSSEDQSKLLITVLLINLALFVIEVVMGYIANSMGLVADSLDMLADVLVYGMSLIVVGSFISRKRKVAKISGYFQLILAFFGFIEVIRRFLGYGEVPSFEIMIIISTLALIGNSASLYLLQRHKQGEVHMQASWIFTANDVLVNIGVILAGILVYVTNSKYPDLIIGIVTLAIVSRGALRILKL